MQRVVIFIFIAVAAWAASSSDRPGDVRVQRVPDGGIQPRVAVAADGAVHLLYFSGDPAAGDIFYVRNSGKPLRVNSHPGSAIALGNIRGPQLALGRNGRVHVAWNGSKDAEPKGPGGATPMLYTRMNDAGTAFEPERNLIQLAYGLDGGGTVAADANGGVFVFWHAPTPGEKGEENRRVWLARSSDDGKTFSRETAAANEPTGACGCCGMAAIAAPNGDLFALYRSATDVVNRDMYLLASHDAGKTFSNQKTDPWKVGYCVMSSASFSTGRAGTFAAWETLGQIHFGRIDASAGKVAHILSAPGEATNRKHPSIVTTASGRTLVAWTEGMGWKKGGSLSWQVYDSNLEPTGESGHVDGVPAFSLIAAFARPDGGFTIVY